MNPAVITIYLNETEILKMKPSGVSFFYLPNC